MSHNTKTAKLFEALSDLYNINGINDFNQLTIEQRVYALLWCLYTNNHTTLTAHTINNLKSSLTDLQVQLKDKIVIENIDNLAIDLHELNTVTSIVSILDKLTVISNKDYTANLNTILTKLTDLIAKDNTTNLDEVLTKLTTLINKDYSTNLNEISTKLNNFSDILTKLDTLISIDNTDELNTTNNLLTSLNTLTNDIKTTRINDLINNNYLINTNSLNYLADRITTALITKLDNVHAIIHSDNVSYETVLSNNTGVAATLSTPARDVGIYETASYLVVVTNMSTNNLPVKVQGSINGNDWTTVPLKYSNLSGNSSHTYTIPSNGTYLFSTEVLTKFIRLTVSNIVTAKVTGQLFVK